MLKSYLKTAIRTLQKNRAYAIVNIVGLAMGIGCALVIFKIIGHETNYDKHQEHFDNIYRISRQIIYPDHVDKGMGTPHPVGPAIKSDFPDIKEVTRTFYYESGQINVVDKEGYTKKFLIDEGIVFAENSYFKIFNTQWIAGNKEEALKSPNTCVIATSMARKLFGLPEGNEANALGMTLDFKNKYEVIGVIQDPPKTTSVPFTLLLEYTGQEHVNPYFYKGTEWNSTSSSTNTYILTNEGFDPASFDEKLVEMVKKYYSGKEVERRRFVTQPLAGIHFDEEYGAYNRTVSFHFLYALGIIGVFLILTACINFINLATAQAANRAKEIGIRKAIGSFSEQLIAQFMSEIALITFLAVIISLAIAELVFISLEDIIGYRLYLDLFHDAMVSIFLAVLFVVVTVLSGFYPSFLLSRMNAVLALKSKITNKTHSGGLSLRKALVVLQFTISQFLIIGTLIVVAQMDYFREKDLGFETDAIINSYLPDQDEVKRERFRQLLLQSGAITDVSFSLSPPTGNSNSHSNMNYAPLQSEEDYRANFKLGDERYLDFYGLKLLAGRNITPNDSNSNNVLINKKIADLMGFKNNYDSALGEILETGWGQDGNKKIVGVLEDFHTQSLDTEIDFAILMYFPRFFYNTSFKISSMDRYNEAIADFRNVWEQVYPEYVIDYEFYDEELAERYESEEIFASMLKGFSIISILIGCLGLYGLISFIAINKTKEIGVRKVLGASVFNILSIFAKEIALLMGIAFVIASPIAFMLMTDWLSNYVYHISMSPFFYIMALLITMGIAFITIGHRSISAAITNPATTLKDE